jgi:multisubunit Na+/H+ antiporter MnhF subunit
MGPTLALLMLESMAGMDYLAGSMVSTLVATFLLCRYRLTHRKPISLSTLALGTLIGNVVSFIVVLFCQEGWHMFTAAAWSSPKGGWGLVVILLGFISAFSALPAFAVTAYYSRLADRDDSGPTPHAAPTPQAAPTPTPQSR